MDLALEILYILIAYFVGAFSPSYTFVYLVKKKDIRKLGDGNPGTRNTFNVLGVKWGILVGLIDVGKGFLMTLIPFLVKMPHSLDIAILAGIAVVLGHSFPAYYGFKGGMGIATTIGVLGVICFREMVWVLIIWLVLIVFKKLAKIQTRHGVLQFIAFLFLIPFELLYRENMHVVLGSSVLLVYFYIRRYVIKRNTPRSEKI